MTLRKTTALTLACAALAGSPAIAQQAGPVSPPFITVQGEASADVVPDKARLSIGVQVERPSAAAATADVARAAQAITDQVKADGIEEKDVATTAIALAPIFPDDTAPRSPKGARAFRASTDLEITVMPAERAGLIASHLVDKGANTIDGIAYLSTREGDVLDQLRADATREARRKAEIYVGALGLHLGRALEIIPGGDNAAPMARTAFAKSMVAAEPTPPIPVKPGVLTLRADVTVRWEIAP